MVRQFVTAVGLISKLFLGMAPSSFAANVTMCVFFFQQTLIRVKLLALFTKPKYESHTVLAFLDSVGISIPRVA